MILELMSGRKEREKQYYLKNINQTQAEANTLLVLKRKRVKGSEDGLGDATATEHAQGWEAKPEPGCNADGPASCKGSPFLQKPVSDSNSFSLTCP